MTKINKNDDPGFSYDYSIGKSIRADGNRPCQRRSTIAAFGGAALSTRRSLTAPCLPGKVGRRTGNIESLTNNPILCRCRRDSLRSRSSIGSAQPTAPVFDGQSPDFAGVRQMERYIAACTFRSQPGLGRPRIDSPLGREGFVRPRRKKPPEVAYCIYWIAVLRFFTTEINFTPYERRWKKNIPFSNKSGPLPRS